LYERHIGKPAHEPANGVTTHNKVPLQSPREELNGTPIALYKLASCVVLELLSKRLNPNASGRVHEARSKGGKDEKIASYVIVVVCLFMF
jgi:hypothetical protein